MRRTTSAFAVLLTAVVAATGAPGASAGPPHVSHGTKPPSHVAAYWTKARMERAIPAERVRGGDPSPYGKGGTKGGGGKPGGGETSTWSSFTVPWPYSGLDRTNGKAFFTLGGVNYVCSGTAVDASTGSLVWTAGHCVTDGPDADATNWMFAPAYHEGETPYGRWAFSALYSTSQWRSSGDFTYDLGAARVSRPDLPGATLGGVVGSRPVAFSSPADQRYRSHGYPAAKKFDGETLRGCDSPLLHRDGSAADAPMGIGCDMTGGSSGGGWITAGGAVASVNSYGYRSLKDVMFGPYQGSVAAALYAAAD